MFKRLRGGREEAPEQEVDPRTEGDFMLEELARAPARQAEPTILREVADAEYEDDEYEYVDEEEYEGFLADDIIADIKNEEAALPELPAVSRALQRAISNPFVSADQLARLIETDQRVADKLLELTASPVFACRGRHLTLSQAVTRLGLQQTCDVVTCLELGKLFKQHATSLALHRERLWDTSLRIGATSAVLASFAGDVITGRAMLAGMAHDLGALAIIHYAEDPETDAYNAQEIKYAIKDASGIVGHALLRAWQFDEELARLPLFTGHMLEKTAGGVCYTDIVRVAKAVVGEEEEGRSPHPTLADMPSFLKLGLQLDRSGKTCTCIEEAEFDLEQVMEALGY